VGIFDLIENNDERGSRGAGEKILDGHAHVVVRVGDNLKVTAEVSDSNGQQLGSGQCELDWKDSATNWRDTTHCNWTATEPSVSKPGVHRITVKARGLGGLLARGVATLPVTVSS